MSAESTRMLSTRTPNYSGKNEVADITLESNSQREERRSWLKARFCLTYAILGAMAVLLIAILIFCIIFALKMNVLSNGYENLLERTQQFLNLPPAYSQQDDRRANSNAPVPSKEEYDEFDGAIKPTKVIYGNSSHKSYDSKKKKQTPEEILENIKFNKQYQGKYIHPSNVTRYTDPDPYRWHKESKCSKMEECPKNVTPPLIIISFDGFAKKYESLDIIKNTQYIKECGVTAEYVIPSYPTKTFPNHYTIATGVYPGVHGLVDNWMYDPEIAPFDLDDKFSRISEFYGADPIWSLYERVIGKPVACVGYLGCVQHEGNKPKYTYEFNFNYTYAQNVEKIFELLTLPEPERPGLLMLYVPEPDDSGHSFKFSDPMMKTTLKETDHLLGLLLNKLHDAKLLDCTNIIVLSDHGMQELKNHINLRKTFPDQDLHIITGPSARFHLAGTKYSQNDIRKQFTCNAKEQMIFNQTTLPPRCHYTNSRSGDIIIEPPYDSEYRIDDWTQRRGDHGWDFLLDTMRAVFYARGPSFKQNEVLPPFQNVEYYNLFAELLGIPADQVTLNNGTLGTLNRVLKHKLPDMDKFYKDANIIGSCAQTVWLPLNQNCANCLVPLQANCMPSSTTSVKSTTSSSSCYKQTCNQTLFETQRPNKIIAVSELVYPGQAAQNTCPFVRADYSEACPRNATRFSLSQLDNGYLATFIEMNDFFGKIIWNDVKAYTASIIQTSGPLGIISGAVLDPVSGQPNYVFRILLSCGAAENWDAFKRECKFARSGSVLSFLFPHLAEDWNCMNSTERLLKYTARVKDIEAVTGLRFFQEHIPYEDMVMRNTAVNLQLW